MPYIPRELNLVPNTDGDPTYRSSMLPFATYANPDGSGEHFGFALPGAIEEPINALARLFGTPSHPGSLWEGPDSGTNVDDMRTLLLSTYGGNALNPVAAIPKGSLASNVLKEAAEAAPIRAYRGKTEASSLFPEPPSPDKRYTGLPEMVWASSHPEVADTYAGVFNGKPGMDAYSSAPTAGAVSPVDMNFSNPMVVDAQGRAWNDIPFNGNWIDSNALSYWARDRGHDGLVIKNVVDHLGGRGEGSLAPADTVVALKRGTVTSPLTGETLFSDTGKPSLMGSAIAGAEGHNGRYFNLLRDEPDLSVASQAPFAGDEGVNRLAYDILNREGDDAGRVELALNPASGHGYVDNITLGNNEFGATGMRDVIRSLHALHPEISTIYGDRTSGAKAGTANPRQTIKLYDDQLPSLFGSALSPYSQEQRNSLFSY